MHMISTEGESEELTESSIFSFFTTMQCRFFLMQQNMCN